MKKAELNQLTEAILHSQKKALPLQRIAARIAVFHDGKVIGYFYPMNDLEAVSKR